MAQSCVAKERKKGRAGENVKKETDRVRSDDTEEHGRFESTLSVLVSCRSSRKTVKQQKPFRSRKASD